MTSNNQRVAPKTARVSQFVPIPKRMIEPLPENPRRYPKTGAMLSHPGVREIGHLKSEVLSLTSNEIAKLLTAMDGIRTTHIALQSYIQGHVRDTEKIEQMRKRMRTLAEQRAAAGLLIAGNDLRAMIHRWCAKLDIPLTDESISPATRLLARDLDVVNHSTLYLWCKQSRQARSSTFILELDAMVKPGQNFRTPEVQRLREIRNLVLRMNNVQAAEAVGVDVAVLREATMGRASIAEVKKLLAKFKAHVPAAKADAEA